MFVDPSIARRERIHGFSSTVIAVTISNGKRRRCHGGQEGRFSQLFVVAPPKFLGILRDAWTPSRRKLVVLETHHDLMTLSSAEVQRRLEKLIAASIN